MTRLLEQQFILTFLLLNCLFLFFLPGSSFADRILQERLSSYLEKVEDSLGGEAQIGVSLVILERTDRVLFQHQAQELLVPASVVKLLTTLAALRILGAQHTFPTEVFVDQLPNERDVRLDSSAGLQQRKAYRGPGNIYFRGYGDPSLVIERLWNIVLKVRALGIEQVRDVIVDDTLFIEPPGASGSNPYEAALSATSLNHNAYELRVMPTASGERAHVSLTLGAPYSLKNRVVTRRGVDDAITIAQVPDSLGFNPVQRYSKEGRHLLLHGDEVGIDISGVVPGKTPETTSYHAQGVTIYQSVPYPASYFASVLKKLMLQNGIQVSGRLLVGETPAAARLALVEKSLPLVEMLRDLNQYSNNFLAGQLLFALGQDAKGYFRRENGLKRLHQTMQELGFTPESYALFDASGLDRRNRLSAQQLTRIVAEAYRDLSISADFISSLSRYSVTGTLKKRQAVSEKILAQALRSERPELERRARGVWGKTGTLNGVSSIAGVLEAERGLRVAYGIIINGVAKERAVEIEDHIIEIVVGGQGEGE